MPAHISCEGAQTSGHFAGSKKLHLLMKSGPIFGDSNKQEKMGFNPDHFTKYSKWIVTEIETGFIHLQYNNPKTLNAYAERDWRDYLEILTALENDPDTNVILISSAVPKAFSSGLNLTESMELLGNKSDWSLEARQKFLHRHIIEFQEAIAYPTRMKTPTIALLNGVSYGLALDIASACSIRVAVEGTRFSVREIKIGLVADMGSLQRMTNLVNNKSKMYQLALTGEVFSPQDALDLGFVSKVVPDLKSGVEYCTELGLDINSNIQWAIKGTKASIQQIVDGGHHEQGLEDVAVFNAINLAGGPVTLDYGKAKL